MGRPRLELVGQVFGRLTVLGVSHTDKVRGVLWKCQCECGNIVFDNGSGLRRPNRSCGCFRIKHGASKRGQVSNLYYVWGQMWQRCTNPKHKDYADYGGRGIIVCERWRDFANFELDMAPRPEGAQLDREKNEIGYEPNNCRWVTSKENNNNKRSNRILEFNGVSRTLAQWSDELGIPYRVLADRIGKLGWQVELALSTPKLRKGSGTKK